MTTNNQPRLSTKAERIIGDLYQNNSMATHDFSDILPEEGSQLAPRVDRTTNSEFKPYHVAFGTKYKGKPYEELWAQRDDKVMQNYVRFLHNMKDDKKNASIRHFVAWWDKKTAE